MTHENMEKLLPNTIPEDHFRSGSHLQKRRRRILALQRFEIGHKEASWVSLIAGKSSCPFHKYVSDCLLTQLVDFHSSTFGIEFS